MEGCTETDLPDPVNTVAALEQFGFVISDNCTADANLRVTSRDASTGTCPIRVTRIYTVLDACGNDNSFNQIFYIVDSEQPTVTGESVILRWKDVLKQLSRPCTYLCCTSNYSGLILAITARLMLT